METSYRFAFRPSSTRRRMASERLGVSSWRADHASSVAINSSERRNVREGSAAIDQPMFPPVDPTRRRFLTVAAVGSVVGRVRRAPRSTGRHASRYRRRAGLPSRHRGAGRGMFDDRKGCATRLIEGFAATIANISAVTS